MNTPSPATAGHSVSRAHEQPTHPATPSTEQVETIVHHLATAYLEVERGLRPPQHLKPHLTPEAYDRLRQRPRKALARGGPVGPRDLGPVTSTIYAASGRVVASLTAREQHDRWSGLLVQLQRHDNRLVVAELARVPLRPQARLPDGRQGRSLAEQVRWVQEERDLVEDALVAGQDQVAADRVGRLRSSDPATPTVGHNSRLAELDHELSLLQLQEDSRRGVEENADLLEPAPPDYITKLIGSPPAGRGWIRLRWDTARQAIDDYRSDYDIQGHTALGPAPMDPLQRDRRSLVIQTIEDMMQQRMAVAPKQSRNAARSSHDSRSVAR